MTINVDDSAVKRIDELRAVKGQLGLVLRVTVDGGGCAGFQYRLALESRAQDGDTCYAGCVATDEISKPFLEGATVRFDEGLIGSEFVIDNPNAMTGCGCGTSFSV